MYTLRIIQENGVVSNSNLGNDYSVTDRHDAPERFQIAMSDYTESRVALSDLEASDVFAFVTDENLKDTPLYKNTQVFVMTYKGHTISRLR